MISTASLSLLTLFATALQSIYYPIDQIPSQRVMMEQIEQEKLAHIAQYSLPISTAESFQILIPHWLADDGAQLYLQDEPLMADRNTLQLIGFEEGLNEAIYLRDHQRVYYNHQPLDEADPHTFQLLHDGLSRDAHHLYFNGDRIVEADPNHYQFLRSGNDYLPRQSPGYGRDQSHLFYDYFPLDGVDPNSFTLYENDEFATDGEQLYYRGERIPDFPITDIRFIGDRFFANDRTLYAYWLGNIYSIPEADPKTFEMINARYARDHQHLYTIDYDHYTIVSGVDPASLQFFAGSNFFKDKHHLYLRLTSFHYGNRDESHLPPARRYDYQHLKIDRADPHTFEVVGGEYGRDKDHIYADLGSHYAVMSFDYDSFEYIGLGFVRDRHHLYGGIYYNFEIMENLDPAAATLIEQEGHPLAIQIGEICFDQYDQIPCPITDDTPPDP